MKKIITILCSIIMVLGIFNLSIIESNAAGTTYYEITFKDSSYKTYKKQVPLSSLKKARIFKLKQSPTYGKGYLPMANGKYNSSDNGPGAGSYFVTNGKYIDKTVNNRGDKVRYYQCQLVSREKVSNKSGEYIYVVCNQHQRYLNNSYLYIREDHLKDLGFQRGLGIGFNYSWKWSYNDSTREWILRLTDFGCINSIKQKWTPFTMSC